MQETIVRSVTSVDNTGRLGLSVAYRIAKQSLNYVNPGELNMQLE